MTTSSIRVQVEEFISMRASLGFEVRHHGRHLRNFARYAALEGHQGPLTIKLAVDWAMSSCAGDMARGERRLGAVRQFAKHRQAWEPKTQVPPVGTIGHIPRHRPPPHIYGREEVVALLEKCDRLLPRGTETQDLSSVLLLARIDRAESARSTATRMSGCRPGQRFAAHPGE